VFDDGFLKKVSVRIKEERSSLPVYKDRRQLDIPDIDLLQDVEIITYLNAIHPDLSKLVFSSDFVMGDKCYKQIKDKIRTAARDVKDSKNASLGHEFAAHKMIIDMILTNRIMSRVDHAGSAIAISIQSSFDKFLSVDDFTFDLMEPQIPSRYKLYDDLLSQEDNPKIANMFNPKC
jgi:hypothetical protein